MSIWLGCLHVQYFFTNSMHIFVQHEAENGARKPGKSRDISGLEKRFLLVGSGSRDFG